MNNPLFVPADVPEAKRREYQKNLQLATHDTGRLMLLQVIRR